MPPSESIPDIPDCTHRRACHCRALSPVCCACADTRPHEPTYTHSGGQTSFRTAKRWSNYCVPCADFWEYQVRRARISPAESHIPEYPIPISSSWPGPYARANRAIIMSRSGKRRAAKKLREGREPIPSRTQSPDSGAEQDRVDREAERELRDREAERERLAGIMRVARQRYERAIEKWSTFTGESSQPAGDAEEQATSSDPLTGVATEHSQLTAVTPPASDLESQLQLSGGPVPGDWVAAEAPHSLPDDDMGPSTFLSSDLFNTTQNFYNTFSTSRALGQGSNSQPLSSPPSDNNSIIDYLAFPPPHPLPAQVATTSESPGPSTSSFHSAFSTGSLYRPDLIAFSNTDEFDFRRYNTPSPPSVDSADDSYPWRTTASFVPQPSATSYGCRPNPLLSPESRELAEEISVLLELLSRTGEVALDEPGHTKAIERAYEDISKLRRHYRIRLANKDGLGAPQTETSKKDEPDATPHSACIICCDDTADVVLIPCHHMVLCEACYDQMDSMKDDFMGSGTVVCPICRGDVFGKIKTFRG